MSKKSKKRNKPYAGPDAAGRQTVKRYQAVVRSPLGEWWHEHKKQLKIGAMIVGGSIIIIYLLFEFFKLVF